MAANGCLLPSLTPPASIERPHRHKPKPWQPLALTSKRPPLDFGRPFPIRCATLSRASDNKPSKRLLRWAPSALHCMRSRGSAPFVLPSVRDVRWAAPATGGKRGTSRQSQQLPADHRDIAAASEAADPPQLPATPMTRPDDDRLASYAELGESSFSKSTRKSPTTEAVHASATAPLL